ncbi:MAG TPA: hypothetical protein VJ997_14495 [Longimicrobiales bacterium]|nr:hypothetical protein [Longimicrobiales bacterium]
MNTGSALLATAAVAAAFLPFQPEPQMKKATPIMTVEAIEPCLPFWTERLGFEVTATVPHGDALGFAMLNKGNVELMYQSLASLAEDLGPAGEATGHPGLPARLAGSTTTLFIEVESLDPVVEALEGADVVVPRRQTFYGMDEIFVQAPCGTLVGFAAPVAGS